MGELVVGRDRGEGVVGPWRGRDAREPLALPLAPGRAGRRARGGRRRPGV